MSIDPSKLADSPEIKEMRAKADKTTGDIIQEAVAIDFKTGLHGPFC